jgi:hypothetical protein
MTAINPVVQETSGGKGGPFIRFLWETLTEADTATSINTRTQSRRVSRSNIKTDILIHATGTFGGATLVAEQSQNGTNWVTARDVYGDDISFTVAGRASMHDDPVHLRFTATGGTSQDIDINLTMRFFS